MNRHIFLAFFGALIAVIASPVFGQTGGSFAVTQSVRSNGGGTVSGGAFKVESTIGQVAAGTAMNGFNIAAWNGFWSSSVVVQGKRPTRFDYDGDGKADLSVFRPSTNLWYLLRTSAGYTAMQFGVAGDLLAPADYDGDGKTDIAVFRPSAGTWYIFASASQSFRSVAWGQIGAVPVPADFDGDGKGDVAVFRASNGTWYRKLSARDTIAITQFGVVGDKPQIGDFDGDGKADLAVVRQTDNVWYFLRTTLGSRASSGESPAISLRRRTMTVTDERACPYSDLQPASGSASSARLDSLNRTGVPRAKRPSRLISMATEKRILPFSALPTLPGTCRNRRPRSASYRSESPRTNPRRTCTGISCASVGELRSRSDSGAGSFSIPQAASISFAPRRHGNLRICTTLRGKHRNSSLFTQA